MLSLTVAAIVVSAAGDVTVGEPEARSARLLDGALAQYAPAPAPAYQPPPPAPYAPPAASNTSARLAELNAREAAIRAQPMPSTGGAIVGIVIGSILLVTSIPFGIWAALSWAAVGVGGGIFIAVAIVATILFIACVAVGLPLLIGGVGGLGRANEARRRQNEQLEQLQMERQMIMSGQGSAPRSTEWAPLLSYSL